MSRDYGKVYGTFWSSQTTASLSDDGKLLALYLMSCSHSTITGVFRLPDGYASEDLNWSSERVQKGFTELLAKGFANRCETSKWVWVVKHLEWNKPENPNQRKSAAKIAVSVPDECGWKRAFMRACGPLLEIPPMSEPNGCETLSEPLLNQEQEQKQKQEQKKEKAPRPSRIKKLPEVSLADWIVTTKASGEKPVPDGDPVFSYASSISLPREFLSLAWREFRARYTQPNAKRYADWRSVFRKAVRENWLKLWYLNGEDYQLTTAGQQAQRLHSELQLEAA